MDGNSRGFRKSVIFVVVLGALLAGLLPATTAAAEDPLPNVIQCHGAAVVTITPNPPGPGANQWSILAKPSCVGDNNGTYLADLTAVGTSDTLGSCDDETNPVMLNFELAVTLTLTSTSNPLQNKVLTQRWSASVTTFPTATPFLITDGGLDNTDNYVGAGNIFTHLYRICPPGGTPSGWLDWVQQL